MSSRYQTARAAQVQWAGLTPKERLRPLSRLRSIIAGEMDRAIECISSDIGKPQMDVLTGDIMVILETLKFLERRAARSLRPRRVGAPAFLFTGARFSELREPHGVVLVLAPWNYPLQLAVVPAVSALACGNAVVIKCSERAPRTAAFISDCFLRAGFPKDLVEVRCDGPEESAALIADRPDFVFFTGSSHNGRVVAKAASDQLIPVALELGGNDACLVFASCDVSRAARGACFGAFSNSGQVCIGTKRIGVERSIWEQFLQTFIDEASALRVGQASDSDAGPLLFTDVRDRLRMQVEDAVSRGATLHTPWQDTENVVRPLILTGVPRDARLLNEEVFGPVVCLAPFDDETSGVRWANDSQFALGASVYTGNRAQGERVVRSLNAGMCSINDSIRAVGNPYASFGGNGASGYGRYHGEEGLRLFTRVKTVMCVSEKRSREVHWFPSSGKMFRALRAMLIAKHSGGSVFRRVARAISGASMSVFIWRGFLQAHACSFSALTLSCHPWSAS